MDIKAGLFHENCKYKCRNTPCKISKLLMHITDIVSYPTVYEEKGLPNGAEMVKIIERYNKERVSFKYSKLTEEER